MKIVSWVTFFSHETTTDELIQIRPNELQQAVLEVKGIFLCDSSQVSKLHGAVRCGAPHLPKNKTIHTNLTWGTFLPGLLLPNSEMWAQNSQRRAWGVENEGWVQPESCSDRTLQCRIKYIKWKMHLRHGWKELATHCQIIGSTPTCMLRKLVAGKRMRQGHCPLKEN